MRGMLEVETILTFSECNFLPIIITAKYMGLNECLLLVQNERQQQRLDYQRSEATEDAR